jgi:phosphoadenosine phosphosulfate reductase
MNTELTINTVTHVPTTVDKGVLDLAPLVLRSQKLISWTLTKYRNVMMTSGFNLNGIVLIDLAVKAGYRGKVVFIDTGYHFRETLQTRDTLAARYPELEFVTLSGQQPDNQMYLTDTDQCCKLRKVIPLHEYLERTLPGAVLNARSRDQAATRANLGQIDVGSERDSVNPLAYWHREELEAYAKEHDLPINPLYFDGFLSIGCAPCTRAVRKGEDSRAGRWEGKKLECGLWTNVAR